MPDKSSAESYQKIFQHCAMGMAHVSPEGRFIEVNPRLCEFLGYSEDELTNMTFQQVTPEEYLAIDLHHVHSLLEGVSETFSIEKQYVHKSGLRVWGRLTVSLVRDAQGNPDFFVSVVDDIAEKKRIAAQLYETERTFGKIIGAMSDHIMIWVASPRLDSLFYVNEGFQKIWGRPQEALLRSPRSYLSFVHPDDHARVVAHYEQVNNSRWELEYRVLRPDGEVRYIRDRGNVITDEKGKKLYLIGLAEDISSDRELENALRRANKQLARMNRIDSLTGLYNRREILHQIEAEVKRLQRSESVATLMFLDLDDFKQINDEYGHWAGDCALRSFAEGLQHGLRESDKLGRYGGDEFLVLLCDTEQGAAEQFYQRLLQLNIHFRLPEEERDIPLKFSCGRVSWQPSFQHAQQWIDAADKQMYRDKQRV
ncbi:diguanylate cyclase [Alteromonas aestuariivivens]|uniref:Diguanylate cyclase n=1 Tax=Alteromonas aestuariivivens TaxID=1938339 RepID=A0A3D8MCY6_9ALTE|nr:diguanylate cyclase [Alteromonas aestuariivivens]RDV27543.1 diguanylate cyclase [Alteromonas aestuariivivens]